MYGWVTSLPRSKDSFFHLLASIPFHTNTSRTIFNTKLSYQNLLIEDHVLRSAWCRASVDYHWYQRTKGNTCF
jgi:hypothetical protein